MKKAICAVILSLALLLTACGGNKEEKYEKALELYDMCAYGEAAKLFKDLGEYESAPDLLGFIETMYQDALATYESGAYRDALGAFTVLTGYKDADKYIKKLEKMPAYSDSEVINAAFQAFKDKRKGEYSLVEAMYHGSDYKNPNVQYDSETKTYTCTLTCTYSTNIIWGTGTSTYYVTVRLLDSGSGLSVVGYSE